MSILKQWLEDNEWSQQDLATETGITVNYLNNILNGKVKDPKISTIIKLHKATELSYEEIIDDLLPSKK